MASPDGEKRRCQLIKDDMSTAWVDLMSAQVLRGGNRFVGRYIEAGQGEPLLLLHGQGGHVENFSRNIEAFSKDHHVFALDLAWHGYGPQPVFNPELVPTWTEQVLDFLNWKSFESAHVLGQSMGGWVAMRLAADHPDRVRKLLLTTAQGFHLKSNAAQPEIVAVPEGALLASFLSYLEDPSLPNIKKRLLALFADPANLPEEVVDIRQKIYADPAINSSLQNVIRNYMGGAGSAPRKHLVTEADLARIRKPTLVYWADKNPLPPPAGERLSAAIPNSEHFLAPNTGHWAQFENAELHNRICLEFLSR
jgi:2-hydroxy-6-oxonona-2,4-dienedioate hydrolase